MRLGGEAVGEGADGLLVRDAALAVAAHRVDHLLQLHTCLVQRLNERMKAVEG